MGAASPRFFACTYMRCIIAVTPIVATSGQAFHETIDAMNPPPTATNAPMFTQCIKESSRSFAKISVVCGELFRVEYTSRANVAHTPIIIATRLPLVLSTDTYFLAFAGGLCATGFAIGVEVFGVGFAAVFAGDFTGEGVLTAFFTALLFVLPTSAEG